MLQALLTTKYHLPDAGTGVVERPRLVARLQDGLRGKLTLVAAPPGSGKTTLFAAWRAGHPQTPLAWLSLDADDNDPALFARYLAGALAGPFPELASELSALATLPAMPPLKSLMTVLINGAAGAGVEMVLALDDYHVIQNREIHAAVDYLLDRLPPTLHLALITRSDPPLALSRLRARQQLVEIRAGDLRFQPDEVAQFFQARGNWTLSEAQLQALERRTEGWIASLQLAALSMREGPDIDAFVESFKGSNRYVMDYLLEEVFNHLPGDLQTFLLSTSILERMTAPLCDALVAGADSQAVLDELQRTNFFVIRLDHEGRWFRYHPLFADLLRYRLKQTAPERPAALHRAAAGWLEQHGNIDEAIHHWIAARDWDHAVALMERDTGERWLRGELRAVAALTDQLPPNVVSARPGLNLIKAWIALLAAQLPQADACLAAAEATIDTDPRWRLWAVAMRAVVARIQGDQARSVQLSREALAGLPEDELIWRAFMLMNLQLAARNDGDLQTAQALGEQIIELSERSGDDYTLMIMLWTQMQLEIEQGRLRAAQLRIATMEQTITTCGLNRSPLRGFLDIARAIMAYEANDLEAAKQAFTAAGEHGATSDIGDLTMGSAQGLFRVYLAQGDFDAARAAIEPVVSFARQVGRGLFVEPLRALEVLLWLEQGDLDRAGSWVRAFQRQYGDNPQVFTLLTRIAPMIIVRWALLMGDLDLAAEWLNPLLAATLDSGQCGVLIKLKAFECALLYSRGEKSAAFNRLDEALSLAQPEGYLRVLAEESALLREPFAEYLARRGGRRHPYADTVGATLAMPKSEALTPSGKALNEREVEILRLLARGLSNQAIADQLYLSINTVKWYIKGIYSKLDADNRTAALRQAQEMHLFDD